MSEAAIDVTRRGQLNHFRVFCLSRVVIHDPREVIDLIAEVIHDPREVSYPGAAVFRATPEVTRTDRSRGDRPIELVP
jgi:hypothetical protein